MRLKSPRLGQRRIHCLSRSKADILSITNRLKGQFNGTNSEWSPTTTGSMGEALQQTEVTVTVNWSGGGAIKPRRFGRMHRRVY